MEHFTTSGLQALTVTKVGSKTFLLPTRRLAYYLGAVHAAIKTRQESLSTFS